jgi:phage terminase large subunit-like protein
MRVPDVPTPPAHLWIPERATSSGEDACDLAESAGLTLDAEQRLAVDAILSERPDGRWTALEAALIVSRQNGKTVCLQAIALADVFLFGAELVVWTAHLFSTAQEAFRDIEAFVTGAPHLSRRIKKIRHENGGESIELTNGSRIAFMARSASAGRGLSGDRVILDEAFALEPAQMGALLPTLSARPNPQVLYASSAGHPKSEILRTVRDRGRRGGDPSLVYIEWSAPEGGCASELCEHLPGTRGCAADDPANWQRANPALGTRIDPEYVAAERRSLPAGEFTRERLGWWDEAEDLSAPIPLDEWDSCQDRASRIVSPKIWALDVTPNGTKATIAVAGLRSDGKAHVELVDSRPGTGWVVDRIVHLSREHQTKQIRIGDKRMTGVLIDPTGPAAELLPQFREFAVTPYIVTARDLAGACGGLQSSVRERGVMHIGQEQVREALANAVRRDVGDGGWAFARRKSEADISPIVAVAVALHGLRISNTAKATPLVAWA